MITSKTKATKHFLLILVVLFFVFTPLACNIIFTPLTTISADSLEVYFVDVGQGDCEIIRSDSKTMLIDSGTNAGARELVDTVRNMGITRFDIVIGTHPHEDHIGGLDTIITNFDIGSIYMPEASTNTKTFSDVLTAIRDNGLTVTSPAAGSTFYLGDACCTVFAPNQQTYSDLNDFSIVIRLDYGETSFLFTGDAQSLSEQEMLAIGYNLEVDILKVGHHGSKTSTSPEFLEAVSPEYAVIEVGAGNDYGHPHQITLDNLTAANIKIFRTDNNGTITVKSDGDTFSITTEK